MKRFISLICACSIGVMSAATVVFAENTTIRASYEDGELIVTDNIGGGETAVVNVYDDGVLCGSINAKYIEGEFAFPISAENAAKKLRIAYIGEGVYDVAVADDTTQEPTVTEAPTEAPTKTPTATATPTATQYPDVYEKALDAIHAPAIVEDVSAAIVDDEEYYAVRMLYQGEKLTVNIRNSVEITSAPQKFLSVCGSGADKLRKGDVIHFVCDLRGRVKNIQLLYRPEFTDYAASGVDFDTLFAGDGYSDYTFGVAVKTYKAGILVADETGKTAELDVSPKAFVYGISSVRNGDVSDVIGTGVSAVNPTYVDKSNFNDSDNVISWSDVSDKVYVLVRRVRGEAMEIVVLEQ